MAANKVYVSFQGLVNGLSARSARTAVISPLAIRQRNTGKADIVGAAITVQYRWDARIGAFLKADNSIFGTGRLAYQKAVVAKRCSPCGLTYAKQETLNVWRCWMPAVCPWCYSRTVQNLFHRTAHAMSVPGRELHGIYFTEHSAPFQLDEVDDTSGRLHRYRDVVRAHLMTNNTLKLSLGSWWSVSAEPEVKESMEGMLKLTTRAILVTDKDVEPVLPPHWKRNIHVSPSFTTVAKEVSRVCRYPNGMLYGDVDQATNILNVRNARLPGHRRSTVNWSDYQGVMRKKAVPMKGEEPADDSGVFEPDDLFTEFPDSL